MATILLYPRILVKVLGFASPSWSSPNKIFLEVLPEKFMLWNHLCSSLTELPTFSVQRFTLWFTCLRIDSLISSVWAWVATLFKKLRLQTVLLDSSPLLHVMANNSEVYFSSVLKIFLCTSISNSYFENSLIYSVLSIKFSIICEFFWLVCHSYNSLQISCSCI